MPGKAMPVQEIHIANSMEELNDKHIKVNDVTINKSNPVVLSRSLGKLLDIAEENLRKGDEEAAYINFMKYLHVAQLAQQAPELRKMKDVSQLLEKQKVNYCLEKAEILSNNLKSRYQILENKRQLSKPVNTSVEIKTKPATPKAAVNGSQVPVVLPVPTYELKVKSLELYELMKRFRGGKGLLIMDARPAKDFLESHIDDPRVISVPEGIIAPGLTANKLEKKLPPSSLALWHERGAAEYVVLVDWSSHLKDVIPTSTLHVLRTILEKWDISIVYKRVPLILDGGYEDWLMTYPVITTNPNVGPPQNDSLLDDMLLDDIEYPAFSDNVTPPKSAPPPLIPSIDRALKPCSAPPSVVAATTLPSESRVEFPQIRDTSSAPTPTTHDISPTPILNTVPAVDRASKQLAIERMQRDNQRMVEEALQLQLKRLEMEKKMEEHRRIKVEEADNEMRQIMEEKMLQQISRLEKLCEQKDLEKSQLREQLTKAMETGGAMVANPEVLQQISTKEAELGAVIKQTDSLAKERQAVPSRATKPSSAPATSTLGGVKRDKNTMVIKVESKPATEERDELKFEALKLDGPSGTSNLTRSHSSPNIKDLDDAPPQFDRGTKPVIRRLNNEYPISRQRDFSPVYGSKGKGLTGLKNLGNSCYMNSIVQCISNTTSLMQYFCEGAYRDDVNVNTRTRGQIVEELAAVVRALWGGEYRSIACRDFKRVAGSYHGDFAGYRQQDSHEFLTLLMDWLHDDLNKRRNFKPPTAAISDDDDPQQVENLFESARQQWREFLYSNESRILQLFYGQQSSTVKCSRCHFESVTFEPFSSLTLVLPGDVDKCTLGNCLDMYLAPEVVSEWKCPRCKEQRKASKKFDIWILPPILVIHFKRFYEDILWRKQHTMVDFPLNKLDMGQFTAMHTQRHTMYDLYAVSNHYGTMDGGHYTTYSRSSVFNKWYKFDDADVSEISESNVRSNAAYILFYASRNHSSPRIMHSAS